jgi:hypothetical protein
MKELRDSIKRGNLQIMCNEGGEQGQAKGICNRGKKTIAENLPNLKKVLPSQVQETSRTPNRLDQNRTAP